MTIHLDVDDTRNEDRKGVARKQVISEWGVGGGE